MNRRGQVTIFIIIGILLVVAVILFFILSGSGIPGTGGTEKKQNPTGFLDLCLEDKIKEGAQRIAIQGGSIAPSFSRNFMFTEEGISRPISYLCYTEIPYEACGVQVSMLTQKIENELQDYIASEVESCFQGLGASLESQGYVVDARYHGFTLSIIPEKIKVNINAELILTKNDQTTTQKDFEVGIFSRLFELSSLAQEIVNQESTYCSFSYGGYTVLYPNYDIETFRTADSDTIYTLKYKNFPDKFRFIVRGCNFLVI